MDTIDQKADKFIDWLGREFSVNSADYPKIREGLVLTLKSQERDTKQALTEYESKTYGKGYALKVEPADRAADVMHFIITGHLLGGRSLDGVTWQEVENDENIKERAEALCHSMRNNK